MFLYMKGDRMGVWIEDNTSKDQWDSGLLEQLEFAPPLGVLPLPSPDDFFVCFQNCLATPERSNIMDGICDFKKHSNDRWRVEFLLKTKLLGQEWTSTYKFPMKHLHKDMDEDQVHDLQGVGVDAHAQLNQSRPVSIRLNREQLITAETKVQWPNASVDEKNFKVHESGKIEFLVAGVYGIVVLVSTAADQDAPSDEPICRLHRANGSVVEMCVDDRSQVASSHAKHKTQQLTCVATMQASDALHLTLECREAVGCSFFAFRLAP